MTTSANASFAPNPQPGRVGKAIIRLFMKQARVTEVEPVAEGFRLITLESPAFKGVAWTPGQKVQIAMGSAFVARTFTPIEWDAGAGRTRILGYAHGDGPGSAWIRDSALGAECDVFGPRASLDIPDAASIRVVLGDETSIGLAYALSRHFPRDTLHCLLEVNRAATAREVLEWMDLDAVDVFERAETEAHLADIERRLPALAAAGATFVLTGNAASIQRQGRALKALGVPRPRLLSKPYWAPGRVGLD
jgi:NADPH-dependent ferric siderophore reductase